MTWSTLCTLKVSSNFSLIIHIFSVLNFFVANTEFEYNEILV